MTLNVMTQKQTPGAPKKKTQTKPLSLDDLFEAGRRLFEATAPGAPNGKQIASRLTEEQLASLKRALFQPDEQAPGAPRKENSTVSQRQWIVPRRLFEDV